LRNRWGSASNGGGASSRLGGWPRILRGVARAP